MMRGGKPALCKSAGRGPMGFKQFSFQRWWGGDLDSGWGGSRVLRCTSIPLKVTVHACPLNPQASDREQKST